MQGPIFLYFSLIQFFLGLYVFFYVKSRPNPIPIPVALLFYTFFILTNTLSILVSVNRIESLVEIQSSLVVFFCVINLYILSYKVNKPEKLFVRLFLILLFIESSYVFLQFAYEYRILEGFIGRSNNIKGFSSNLNVTAFSILIKIPILFYHLVNRSNFLIKIALILVLFTSTFCLLVLSSRAAILGLLLFCTASFIYVFILKKKNRINYLAHFLLLILIVISNFKIQSKLYSRSKSTEALNRISNFSDSSTNARIGFYKDAIDHILDYPILGSGAGTWKIISIKYDSQNIQGYQVPYSVHNDFLQVGAESGIFALIFYLGLFVIPIFLLLKLAFQEKSFQQKSLFYFLCLSLLIYCLDSSINFPKERPVNLMNFVYIYSIVLYLISIHSNTSFSKKVSFNKKYFYLVFFISPFLIYGSYLFFKSSVENTTYYLNQNFTKNFDTPLSIISQFEDTYPSLGYASVSNKIAKAKYYIYNKNYDEAIKLINEGIKDNPYLMMGENELSKMYLELNQLDSAYVYAKKAFYGLPNNESHATVFQKVLFLQNKAQEFDSLKYIYKGKDELFYQNQAFFLSRNKIKNLQKGLNSESNTKYDIEFLKNATSLFPNNSQIQSAYKVYLYSKETIIEAQKADSIARKEYLAENYENAINNWETALEIIPNDDAYYLNIAQCLIKLKKHKDALRYLKKLDKNNLDNSKGYKDMLYALSYIGINNKLKACEYIVNANKFNYPNSKNLFEIVCN